MSSSRWLMSVDGVGRSRREAARYSIRVIDVGRSHRAAAR